jgi:hypothetical protein
MEYKLCKFACNMKFIKKKIKSYNNNLKITKLFCKWSKIEYKKPNITTTLRMLYGYNHENIGKLILNYLSENHYPYTGYTDGEIIVDNTFVTTIHTKINLLPIILKLVIDFRDPFDPLIYHYVIFSALSSEPLNISQKLSTKIYNSVRISIFVDELLCN